MTSSVARPRLRYSPPIDGLRALAVAAVVLYHADVPWLPGGFLGVEVFFVISGYLISSLLLLEHTATAHTHLLEFYRRRARRLFPALWVLIACVLSYARVRLPAELGALRNDACAALAYCTNWYLVLVKQSYFEQAGRPSLFKHLWSLAVEEQFYLVWPPLFALVFARLRARHAVPLLLLLLGTQKKAGLLDFVVDSRPVLTCGDPTRLCPRYEVGFSDGLHFGAEGHERLGEALLQQVFSDCR